MSFSMIYFLALFLIVFLIAEVKPLAKQGQYKELAIALLLLLIALSYGTDYAMNWHLLPNPNKLITALRPVSQAFDAMFGLNQ